MNQIGVFLFITSKWLFFTVIQSLFLSFKLSILEIFYIIVILTLIDYCFVDFQNVNGQNLSNEQTALAPLPMSSMSIICLNLDAI